jgi:hypothetical protein
MSSVECGQVDSHQVTNLWCSWIFDTQEIWWLFERFWLQASQTVAKKHAFKASQKGKDFTSRMRFNWARQHTIAWSSKWINWIQLKNTIGIQISKFKFSSIQFQILIESPSHPASSLDSWVVFWIGIKIGTWHLTGTNKQTNHHVFEDWQEVSNDKLETNPTMIMLFYTDFAHISSLGNKNHDLILLLMQIRISSLMSPESWLTLSRSLENYPSTTTPPPISRFYILQYKWPFSLSLPLHCAMWCPTCDQLTHSLLGTTNQPTFC